MVNIGSVHVGGGSHYMRGTPSDPNYSGGTAGTNSGCAGGRAPGAPPQPGSRLVRMAGGGVEWELPAMRRSPSERGSGRQPISDQDRSALDPSTPVYDYKREAYIPLDQARGIEPAY